MKKRLAALLLCAALALSLSGCGTADTRENAELEAEDLMAGIVAQMADSSVQTEETAAQAMADFALRLFQNSAVDGENTLISPLSVLCALAMTANGAQGDTLAQMEELFGLDVEGLNAWLSAYLAALPDEDGCKLSLANSIWFRDVDSLSVEQGFLQANADYYGTDIYRAAFDEGTLKDINSWVSGRTDGMIENILDEIPQEAVLYLINALAFDAQWEDIYEESQIRDGTFTLEDGTEREAELMYSTESVYLEDENAAGFLKYYEGGRYAFAALLPNENVTVAEYVSSLTGEGLAALLENAGRVTVHAAIPKFESDYSVEMNEILEAMGMSDAFDGEQADFSAMAHSADGNIFISRVLHKTYISVDEAGTKAGAATVVEAMSEAAEGPVETKTVYLNRPFVYMILDCENNTPVFIGTVMDVGR
ncbi:MAG: serpin family protein [Oscillospiraceae bacterium]|nr:serpin family protein [Oscillospiraceae bacterium]